MFFFLNYFMSGVMRKSMVFAVKYLLLIRRTETLFISYREVIIVH